MQLSVIIVSYNVRYFIRQCLDSLFRSSQVAAIDVEVFVVDNDSQDGTIAYLKDAFPSQLDASNDGARLCLIANRHNVGFGRANNQALRHCKGEYVLFLNPDTILTEHTLLDCLSAAREQPKLGAIGVAMLQANGQFAPESRRGLPTPWVAFCRMSGLTKLFPKSRKLARYYMSYLSQEETAPIDIVSGAFMFCSREALNEVGGFDEDFFMYGEDIDLSYRFLKAGYQNFYVPTPIVHYKGESTHKNSYRYVHVFYEAMLIFFQKHFPTSSLAIRIPVRCAIYTRALLALLQQLLKKWSRFLTPKVPSLPLQLRVIGSDNLKEQWQGHADVWGLQFLSATETPKSYSFCGFSPEETSYTEIVKQLRTLDRKQGIATFFPSWGIMITGKEIFE
ncbi:glycosyltransferase family 2 protein [Ihuprevotella massiliensis]|uniref:glycosyltransferase family 2 protein n=1 Tax=Ihuprevotella massiliensis TaxID=1852368 RepID=UPI00094E5FDB